MKTILSISVLVLFGLFAMASFGSTNTQVQVGHCRPKPSFTGKLTIDVTYRHIGGTGIPNAAGTIFLVHQIIQDTATCQHSVVLQQQIPFMTNVEGSFPYVTPEFTHTNEGDLWRIEVMIPPVAGRYKGSRSVSVAKYNTTQISSDHYEPTEL